MKNEKMIVDMNLGDRVKKVFYLKEAEFRLRRDGRTIDGFLRISDSSGDLEAVYWGLTGQKLEQVEKMQFAMIEGQINKKKSSGQMQMSITSIENVPEGISFDDLIPSSSIDIEKVMKEIDQKISSIKNPYLKALLHSFFNDKNIRKEFKIIPAAKKLHHAFKGGLAEHTLNVSRICETLCEIHPRINRDFLISAALLHDIGKLEEYQLSGTIEHTDKGKLIGHIIIGTEMVEKRIRQIEGFPEDLAIMLKHTLLSHHGKLEYGSPKLPSILPAIALFYADDADAKINGLIALKDENKNLNKKWSEWVWWLERPIFLADDEIIGKNEDYEENGLNL